MRSESDSRIFWTGAHYIVNRNNYVWIVSEQILPQNSSLWCEGLPQPFPPSDDNHCVYICCVFTELIDGSCYLKVNYICELDHLHANTYSNAAASAGNMPLTHNNNSPAQHKVAGLVQPLAFGWGNFLGK